MSVVSIIKSGVKALFAVCAAAILPACTTSGGHHEKPTPAPVPAFAQDTDPLLDAYNQNQTQNQEQPQIENQSQNQSEPRIEYSTIRPAKFVYDYQGFQIEVDPRSPVFGRKTVISVHGRAKDGSSEFWAQAGFVYPLLQTGAYVQTVNVYGGNQPPTRDAMNHMAAVVAEHAMVSYINGNFPNVRMDGRQSFPKWTVPHRSNNWELMHPGF